MKEPELLKEYLRLTNPASITDQREQYNTVMDTAISLVYKYGDVAPNSQYLHEGHLLFQLAVFKSLSINQLIEGVQFQGKSGIGIKPSLDPFAVWPIVRAQFESYCLFNNIYVNCISTEETVFKYNLWTLSGLNYRQSSLTSDTPKEFKGKAALEAKKIDKLEKEIFDSPFLTGLNSDEAEKVKGFIKKKKFQVFLNSNGKLVDAAWHELFTNSGAKKEFSKLYTIMSMATHPSNVSVFQFRDIFKGGNSQEMMTYAIQFSSITMCCMIRDYCTAFPSMVAHFNNLPKVNQLIVNSFNGSFRGKEYKINELMHELWGELTLKEVKSFLNGDE